MGKRIELTEVYRPARGTGDPRLVELEARLAAVEAEKALAREKNRKKVAAWRKKRLSP